MRTSIVLGVLLGSTAAHAMGTSYYAELVAWSADGSSALVRHQSERDGDTTESYDVISAGDKQAPHLQISGVSWVDDKHPHAQAIDQATCRMAVKTLQASLTAHGFRDVSLHAEVCAKDVRGGLVTVGAEVERAVASSWVALPMGRAASARERATWDAVATALPDAKVGFPVGPGEPTLDAANSVRMILVFDGLGGGSPERTNVLAFVPAKKTSYALLLED